jgi:branched-chain amino acid transport system substrate-binding protein
MALGLIAAACGGSDDVADVVEDATEDVEEAAEDTEEVVEEAAEDTEEDVEEAVEEADDVMEEAADGVFAIAEGVTIDPADCPSDWSNTSGLEDEIKLGISLPQSGALAAFGAIADGMQAYFDFVNENDPIDGKEIELVVADDAYDPARTQTNVEDIIETDEVGAFAYIIGTANNGQVRPLLDEECIPQLFNSTGFPAWGDPGNFPWTIGGLLAYSTEADIWCGHIRDELGDGTTVAGLFMNNDFGKSYQTTVENCEGIDLVESLTHEATAADISNELTTLAASGADAFVLGSTGAFCPQAMAGVAGSPWEPLFMISNTCNAVGSFFTPVDPAGQGVRMANTNKSVGDVASDDPAIAEWREVLEAAGIDPDSGSASTGIIFGITMEEVLRKAAAMEGGLTRTNIMAATYTLDFDHKLLLDGIRMETNGTADSYAIEGAYIEEYQAPEGDGVGTYDIVSELITVEGETGTFGS